MIKRFIAALLVLTVTFFGCIQPSYAAPESYNNGNSRIESQYDNGSNVSNLLSRCWNLTPANAGEKMICEKLGWGVSTLGTLVATMGACYAIDAGVTTIFPPAALLAPLCNGAGGVVARQALPVLAH